MKNFMNNIRAFFAGNTGIMAGILGILTVAGTILGLCSFKRAKALLADKRGDLATNTIGGIIVAVVIIGLLVVAVNAFFPNFFTDMFEAMADKLNANW